MFAGSSWNVLARRVEGPRESNLSIEFYLNRYLFPTCLILVCGASLFVGVVPTRIFGHDTFFLLDNGWRIVEGQRPHIDFASPWGPLGFLVVGFGLVLSGYSADGIGYGNTVVGLIVGVWSFRLGRARLVPLTRILLSLYLVVLTVAPYPLGWGVLRTGHAMFYNRYGYALLGLVMLECFASLRGQPQRREEWIGALSTGSIVALVLFLKISYFFVALLLIATALLHRGICPRRLLRMLIGFTTVCIVFLVDLDFNLAAILGDFVMAAGARSGRLYFSESASKVIIHIPYFFLLLWLVTRGVFDRELRQLARPRFTPFLTVSLVFAAEMLLLCTNQQPTELALTPIFLLVANSAGSRYALVDPPGHPTRSASRYLVAACSAVFLVPFALGCAGLAYGVWLKAYPPDLESVERFTEPHLAPLILYDEPSEPESNGRPYSIYIKDGIRLLQQNTTPDETILTMDMFNPFSFALRRQPPVGGISAAAYRYTLSETYRPSDEKYFGNADIVMVPKRPAVPGVFFHGFFALYEAGLYERFQIAAESPLWYLYKRK